MSRYKKKKLGLTYKAIQIHFPLVRVSLGFEASRLLKSRILFNNWNTNN